MSMLRGPQKDALIGVLALLLILATFQDYLLPSQWYAPTYAPGVGDGTGPRNMRGALGGRNRGRRAFDYDIVVSYYNEGMDGLRDTIRDVKAALPPGRTRVIVYYKGNEGRESELTELADEVVPLKNVGREGETYLAHIVRHYPTGQLDFAAHTLFLQPHIAWEHVMRPRLPTVHAHTGFMSFGPYLNMTNGVDVQDVGFERITDMYAIFRQALPPPERVLASWAGQFVVSRRRILGNSFEAYRNLRDVFHAPAGHWLWKEGWWDSQPSNPTLGHALERSWPTIFDCTDPVMADECGEKAGLRICECLD